MAIHPAYAQVTALFFAILILVIGNGLLQTLLPLSADEFGFSGLSVGLIGSAYYVGMLGGCVACPRMVARAGHIRAFAAFAAITAVTALVHPIVVDPIAWMAIRVVGGFCFAGLFATGESWLHDKAENVVRGRVMAFYTMAFFGMVPIGSLIGGVVADRLGAPMTVRLSGVACLLAGLWFATRLPAIRALARPVYVKRGIIAAPEEEVNRKEP